MRRPHQYRGRKEATVARVLASSSNLLRHIQAHSALGAEWVEFRIEAARPNCGMLASPTGKTELPIEGRGYYGKGAMLSVPKLLKALKSIPDQPITLDVHEASPCKLFAYSATGTDSGFASIEFAI
jgi:hypothetical protein